jgi:hypothetical protein
MANDSWIESVYPLATLPTPLNSSNGRVTGSVVSSLTKGKKRKRTEIATAVDGEGISIYSVSALIHNLGSTQLTLLRSRIQVS